jgi:DNA polymerase elongation subunit (family B)
MHELFVDIETLPTNDETVKSAIAASITAPSNYSKIETIAKWEAESKPALVEEAIAKTSFDGSRGRICSIAWAWNDEPVTCTMLINDEKEFLTRALSLIEIDRPKNEAFHQTRVIGHYVADFDIRFIWQRAFILGVKVPVWMPRSPKPWDKEVFDTMAQFAGAKGSISLDNLCKAMGIEGKGDVDGSMVSKLWDLGDRQVIGDYNMDDVDRVRRVYRKMQIAYGERE